MRGLATELEKDARVFLRYPARSDAHEYLDLRRASRRFHGRWEPSPPAGIDPFGMDTFQAVLEHARTETSDRTLVCDREGGAIVGSFHLSQIFRRAFQSAFLGYWVGEAYARQGYMSAGLPLLLRHAFRRLELHRIEANIRPENGPSIALVQRAGFRLAGVSPRYLKIGGRWRDHGHWELLAEEWAGTWRA